MANRQFVTWTTEPTPYGSASWAMIDGLLHVRSGIGTKVAELGSLTPQVLTQLLMWESSNEPACCGGDVLVGNLVRALKSSGALTEDRRLPFWEPPTPALAGGRIPGKQVILTPAAPHGQ